MRIWLAALALAISELACSSSAQNTPAEGDPSAAGEKPPKAAAGFEFGAAPGEIKKACQGAGKTWSSVNDISGTCSGAAGDIDLPGTVRVDFCDKKSCVIAFEHRPTSNWLATYNDVKAKLAKKYGIPAVMPKGIPEKCGSDERFAQCLDANGLRLVHRWQWPSRHQVTFTAGKPDEGSGPAALRIEYVAPVTEAPGKPAE
jgi:hypothetical protein